MCWPPTTFSPLKGLTALMNQQPRVKSTRTEITHRWHTQPCGDTDPMPSLTSAASLGFPNQPQLLSSQYSTFTAIQQSERGEWEGDRERWEGERITINRIMRQGPVQKDSSLRTVGRAGKKVQASLRVIFLSFLSSPATIKKAAVHANLFSLICAQTVSRHFPLLPGQRMKDSKARIQFQL